MRHHVPQHPFLAKQPDNTNDMLDTEVAHARRGGVRGAVKTNRVSSTATWMSLARVLFWSEQNTPHVGDYNSTCTIVLLNQ